MSLEQLDIYIEKDTYLMFSNLKASFKAKVLRKKSY